VKWWQWFLVFVAWTGLVFLAGHWLWPATTLVEIPGKVVLDSAATQALEVRLDGVRAQLILARANVARDRAALTSARALYADLAARLDSIEHADPGAVEWPAAAYDTTVQHMTPLVIQVGDSLERRTVLQEIRLSGQYVLPPIGEFRSLGVLITPSTIYYSRQLPGQKVEIREVLRWQWLPAAIGYTAGTIVTTLIALLLSR
jgi:hypothetical protein